MGGNEISQTQSLATLFEHDFNIKIELIGIQNQYSVEQLAQLEDQNLLLYPGSILTNADLNKLDQYHNTHERTATVLVNKGLQYRVGLARIHPETNVVTEFMEKPFDKTLSAFTGIIQLREGWKSQLLEFLRSWQPSNLDVKVSSLDQFVDYLISQNQVKVCEISPVLTEDDPWWIDLSELETWMKLDSEEIFHRLRHLNV